MMLTIDASVFINAANREEAGSSESLSFLKFSRQHSLPIYSPTLLLVEVVSSISRVFRDPLNGIQMIREMQALPGHNWIPLDYIMADEAARLGAAQGLRGSDAVYAAVTRRQGTTLVTLDRQQLERLGTVLTVKTPAQILQELSN